MAKDLSKMIPLKMIYESFDHESIMVPQVVWLSCKACHGRENLGLWLGVLIQGQEQCSR